MGRIHRYGQEKDCLIFNFVSTNTREGRVLQKLFERIKKIEDDLDPKRTGKVFNVLGDVFPANQLERMLRDMYAHNKSRKRSSSNGLSSRWIPSDFKGITHSTLEGLAKRELNLSAILGKSAEAKERRLVPEVIEDFFLQAAPVAGRISPKEPQGASMPTESAEFRGIFGRSVNGWSHGSASWVGSINRSPSTRRSLTEDPTLEWVTPGHPLFESVREDVRERVQRRSEHGRRLLRPAIATSRRG